MEQQGATGRGALEKHGARARVRAESHQRIRGLEEQEMKDSSRNAG